MAQNGSYLATQAGHVPRGRHARRGRGAARLRQRLPAPRLPDGIGRTLEITDYRFGEDVPAEIAQEVLDFDMHVAREDTDLVVSVQAGLASSAVTQGRLMRESEQFITDFQQRVYDALA